MLVREWMTMDPKSVTPAMTVLEARGMMHRLGFRHLPVVDSGWLAGMVSDRDVVGDDDKSVCDVMTSPVHTAHADDDVRAVARLLLSRRIDAVPVVDDQGLLIGMMTTTDCLLAFLQGNATEAGVGRNPEASWPPARLLRPLTAVGS